MDQQPTGKWISILGRYYQLQMAKLLEPYHIGPGQYPFILAVCSHPGIRQDRLAEKLFLNKSSVARAAAALEQQGYLLRKVDAHDKRALQVFPTEKAMACRFEIIGHSRALAEEMTAGFTECEKQQLNHLLERIGKNLANGGVDPCSLYPPDLEAAATPEEDKKR